MKLIEKADEIYEVNVANGWFEEDRGYDADIVLLHSEISEALEAYREDGFADVTAAPMRLRRCRLTLWEDTGGRAAGVPRPECDCPPPKPEGVGSELADVLIRFLDTAKRRAWDLLALEQADRAFETWGNTDDFLGSLRELHYVTSVIGVRPDVPSTAVLGTFLKVLRRAAMLAEVDLDTEYARKIAYNRTRGHRHGGKRV